MTTRQERKLALLVVLMLMSTVAASTKAQSQLAPYERDPPNVFDGVLSNVAGSSEISTGQLRAALNDGSAIISTPDLTKNIRSVICPARERFRPRQARRLRCTSATQPRSRKPSPTKLSL